MRRGHYDAPHHIQALTAVLEAVERREITRLIVNMPPRHGKSLTASEICAAWHLGRRPDNPIIVVSYSAARTLKISRKVRNIVKCAAYREVFPDVVLSTDSQSVEDWELDGWDGGLKAVGIGGSVAGFGAGLLIIDDPHKNRAEADSEVMRENVWDAYAADLYTRLSPDGVVVVIHTRWHEDDLTGRLLAAQDTDPDSDSWHVLHMPALDDNENALWPERYPAKRLRQIRATLGPYDWQSLYQGNPTAPEGSIFKRDYFNVVDPEDVPEGLQWASGIDLAASAKETADYTAIADVATDKEGNVWIRNVFRAQQQWPETVSHLAKKAQLPGDKVWGVESFGFQLSAVQTLLVDERFQDVAIFPVTDKGDKVAKAMPWLARAAAFRVFLVRGKWNNGFLAEALGFPLGKHDDQVDAVSIAWATLVRWGYDTYEDPTPAPEPYDESRLGVIKRWDRNRKKGNKRMDTSNIDAYSEEYDDPGSPDEELFDSESYDDYEEDDDE